MKSVTPSELKELLLHVAPARPIHIWGPPGIAKTAIVNAFGSDVGMPAVSMPRSQLAPGDLLGVSRIVGDRYSVFAPPRLIAGQDRPIIPSSMPSAHSALTEPRCSASCEADDPVCRPRVAVGCGLAPSDAHQGLRRRSEAA